MTRKQPTPASRLRIIGGEWRSRMISFPEQPDIRPTPDRVRETLFNWLQGPVVGARCLDLFAGSGALGFEALSRGATAVTALELNARSAAAIRDNATLLKTDRMTVLQRDACEWLATNPTAQRYDLVFLDPPFASGLYTACCELLEAGQWLAPGALVYLESDQDLTRITLPSKWALTRNKRAGTVHYGLCQTG